MSTSARVCHLRSGFSSAGFTREDDGLNAARGIGIGVSLSVVFWVAVASVVLLAGCDKAPTVAPAPSPVVPPAPIRAVCAPFSLEWDIARNLASPTVTVMPRVGTVEAITVVGEHGSVDQGGAVLTFQAAFDTAYQVRGRVGGCWSEWFGFRVSPNPVGPEPEPTVPACDIDSRTGECQ